MGFISENNYFIKLKLQRDMSKLNATEKKVAYQAVKKDVRSRLTASYRSANDKTVFYAEAFEVLAEFDCEYIFYNLFFEKDFAYIINALMSSDFISQIKHNTFEEFIGYRFLKFVESNKKIDMEIKDMHTYDFIFQELSLSMPNFERYTRGDIENLAGIITRDFIEFLKQTLLNHELPIVEKVFSLLIKAWNSFPVFSNTQKYRIVLYNEINKYLEDILASKSSEDFHLFIKSAKVTFEQLFTPIKYIPLLDKSESKEYKEGYLKHREVFWEIYERIEIIHNISKTDSYTSLLKTYENNPNSCVLNAIKNMISDKLVNLDTLTDVELAEIELYATSEEGTHLKRLIFEKFYLFEKLI